ncbi:MAG: nucleotidyltransferase [Sphingobacteriia bacterium]|nr:nucleotidyltransferase [Sphingobacteriia bacterium]
MLKYDFSYLERCVNALSKAFQLLQKSKPEEIDYDIYRSACVKEFEIIIEQCGKMLRKFLKPYLHSSKAVDQLYFKEVFKQSVLRGIITPELGERFLEYRDNRNNTAHDYGVNFAQETLVLLPQFICDVSELLETLKSLQNDTES